MARFLAAVTLIFGLIPARPVITGNVSVQLSAFRGNGGRVAWSPTGEFTVNSESESEAPGEFDPDPIDHSDMEPTEDLNDVEKQP